MEQTVALKVLVNTNNTWIGASYHFYSLLDQYVLENQNPILGTFSITQACLSSHCFQTVTEEH